MTQDERRKLEALRDRLKANVGEASGEWDASEFAACTGILNAILATPSESLPAEVEAVLNAVRELSATRERWDSLLLEMTDEQRENMLHALGSSHGNIGWRNYYCAGPADFDSWDDLVSKGFANTSHINAANVPDCKYFRVTDVGIIALGYSPSILVKPIKYKPGVRK